MKKIDKFYNNDDDFEREMLFLKARYVIQSMSFAAVVIAIAALAISLGRILMQ